MNNSEMVEFGAMKATIQNLEKKVEKMEITLQDISKIMSEARGGWKVMIAAGTLAATLAGLVGAFLHKVFQF